MKHAMRIFLFFLSLISLSFGAGSAMAQGLFSPAIKVNGDAVTYFELEQRKRMLVLLNAPGDPSEVAREQLIDDRLRVQAARRFGVEPSEEEIQEGMAEFAARANMTREKFIEEIEKAGVAEETFRDFVYSGLVWRTVVQGLFGSRAAASEDEIDRASAGSSGQSIVRVLLSEIIIPMQPGNEDEVRALAAEIARYTDISKFAQAARQYSATQTRGSGGRLGWQSLDELPAPLQSIVLSLAPGEVTDPLPIQNAIALFQMRAIEETAYVTPQAAALEYAQYLIPGGQSDKALDEAARIKARIDRCDDLYGIAKGQPEERLERVTLPPDEIPADIAAELDRLDPDEISTALTRNNGQTLVVLMLCGRTMSIVDDETRQNLAIGLRNQRLNGFANSYLAQLRSDARIFDQ
ncbi:MAG: peptidylprolyl isomerase [Rhodobacteraceae bacterium]|nr:peptidylprolyl isomerase [Paracoccaceae bacterium]